MKVSMRGSSIGAVLFVHSMHGDSLHHAVAVRQPSPAAFCPVSSRDRKWSLQQEASVVTSSARRKGLSSESELVLLPQRDMIASRKLFDVVSRKLFEVGSVSLRASTTPQTTGDDADGNNPDKKSWMADPGDTFNKDRSAFAVEAENAAKLVTSAIRDEYERDGVTVVRRVVSERWVETLRVGCKVAQDEAGTYSEYLQRQTDDGIFFQDLELARRLPVFAAFSLYGPCAAVAGAVMGSSSIRYLYDQLFIKEKGVSTHTPWHQDGGYWRVAGSQIGSVFVPLDPVTHDECLAFVVGSHKWELHNPQHFIDGSPYVGTSLPPLPDVDKMVRRGKAKLKTFDLMPGDVLVFSSRTAHGGPGNWGRALSTRWTGDGTTFWARPGEGAVPTNDVGLADGEILSQNAAAFPEVWCARNRDINPCL